jgi:O-antigen/teichoic acid export membrane protein
MSRAKNLLKNSFILSLGNFLPHVGALVTLPIYTGMLTKTEMGRYDLVTVSVYIITVILTLQIHQAVFRFLIDVRGKAEESLYISNALIFEIIPAIVASLIFGWTFNTLPMSSRLLLGFYLFLYTQFTVVGQIARGLGKNRAYSIAYILSTVGNVVLVLALMVGLKRGFDGLFLSLNLSFLAGLIYLSLACGIHRRVNLRLLNKSTIKVLLNYSWPMVPNTMSIWTVNTFSRWVIRAFLGLQMNAVFAVAGKIPNIFNLAYSTFNMAWQESASIAAADHDKDVYYSRTFNAFYNFITGALMLLIASTPILFKLLIKGSYEEAYNQIPILYIGVFFSSLSSFFGSIYVAQKRTKSVGISSAIAALTSCALSLLFIKQYGLYAASFSMVISFFVLAVYRGIDLRKGKIAQIDYHVPRILIGLVLVLVCSILCFQQNYWLDLVNIGLSVFVFVILNFGIIRSGLEIVGKKLNEYRLSRS